MENEAKLKKINIVISVCSVLIIVCLTAIGFIYVNNRDKEKFVYENNLDSLVVTIDDYKYDLQEVSYYIIKMEAYVDEAARLYNEDNPRAYWNLYISNHYVSAMAKDTCMDLIIRDYVYANEAKLLNLTLSEEKVNSITDEVQETLKNMTSSQMAITNYSEKDLYDILYRIAMAERYVSYISSKDDSLTEDDFNPEGKHYEKIIKKYDIKINKKIWNNVNIGRVSINNE